MFASTLSVYLTARIHKSNPLSSLLLSFASHSNYLLIFVMPGSQNLWQYSHQLVRSIYLSLRIVYMNL